MKKLLAVVLAALMLVPMLAACNSGKKANGVAMITDYGDINDESFNQTTYEACKEYCEANGINFDYFKPIKDSTAERVAKVEEAIDKGYGIIVMPGYAFAGTIHDVQDKYKDVKFIALDVSEYDVEDSFYNHDENGNRTTLINENEKYHLNDNVFCAVYQEELCGYMAGYAAVKLGYKHLGFLGGMAVPAVIRYGYGFVQGCDAAAVEMGITDQVTVEYVYGNQFFGDPGITAYMDTWYQVNGVEVVFACGGGIYNSAVEAARKANGKVIGVDVDQAAIINKLGESSDMTVTSAMKGLGATVKSVLEDTIKNGKWANYGGKIETLGLVSGDDPELNYVQLPMKSTQWGDGFTQENYKELVSKMFKGEIIVDNGIGDMPATSITVNAYPNIK